MRYVATGERKTTSHIRAINPDSVSLYVPILIRRLPNSINITYTCEESGRLASRKSSDMYRVSSDLYIESLQRLMTIRPES